MMELFPTSFDSEFEAFWKSGAWRKLGKLEAHRYFRETVKTMKDWEDIQRARDHYAIYVRDNPWYCPCWGERWFRPKKGIPYWHRWLAMPHEHTERCREFGFCPEHRTLYDEILKGEES